MHDLLRELDNTTNDPTKREMYAALSRRILQMLISAEHISMQDLQRTRAAAIEVNGQPGAFHISPGPGMP